MNSPLLPVPGRAVFRGWLAVAALILAAPTRAAVSPGPAAQPAVNLSDYRVVLHVDQARGDDIKGDGSLKRPYAGVVAALEAAGRPEAGARVAVLVSAGRYRQPTFALKSHVDLFGGYASPGGSRDIYRHATVLDGEGRQRIAFGADHARIDGFHFVDGQVRGKGAALLCDGTSPSVTHCVFVGNRTLIPLPWNPPLLHETAHDGGAIMVLNGGAPRIAHCLFYSNTTECGRGAALAADRGARPQVVANVFTNNRAGLDDPMRSSDGGAVSFFDGSGGVFEDNVVVANESLTRNDAGGVFVALWSAPAIRRNVIVANESGDDAGGLFLGGQEHRYDAPLDPYPPADRFEILVEGNLFVGNANSSRNSGAMRVTMESRARFQDNVIAENAGGFYLQRSEIVAERNTVWQEWRFLEDKAGLGPSRFTGNILKGPADAVEARVTFSGNMAGPGVPGGPHRPVEDVFLADGLRGGLSDLRFDPATLTTVLTAKELLPAGVDFAGRAIKLADNLAKGGQWRVIARASGTEIVIWGRLDAVTKAPALFEILRTFTPKPDVPAGLGARRKQGAPATNGT
ncbi:MAG: right-handed parallel beta-helix repeat-containing protein [Opitutaceae bacterium]